MGRSKKFTKEEARLRNKQCKARYRKSARGRELSAINNTYWNPINNTINNPINNPITNAKKKKETLERNMEIIRNTPDLSEFLLSKEEFAAEAEKLWTKPLDSLGGKSIQQVT